MHQFTVSTKFTFGERVNFDSVTQHLSGTGTVVAIIIEATREAYYMLVVDPPEVERIQPGILEEEMTLLTSES